MSEQNRMVNEASATNQTPINHLGNQIFFERHFDEVECLTGVTAS
jgi:hypothetical protein